MSVIDEIIEYLQGTCKSLSNVCRIFGIDVDDLTEADLGKIDDKIFCCDDCGWWYESPGINDEGDLLCPQCMDDREEDEDLEECCMCNELDIQDNFYYVDGMPYCPGCYYEKFEDEEN